MQGWQLSVAVGLVSAVTGVDDGMWPMVACSEDAEAVVVESPNRQQVILPLDEMVAVKNGTLQLSLMAPHHVEVMWRETGSEPVGLWYAQCTSAARVIPTTSRAAPESLPQHEMVEAESVIGIRGDGDD